MVTRTLEERLTARLLALAGAVLVGVAVTAVVVIDRSLAASDTVEARAHAQGAHDALERELAEGDTPPVAEAEVTADSRAAGFRLAIVHAAVPSAERAAPFAGVASGECSSFEDESGASLRACAAGDEQTKVVAALSTAEHEGVVRAVARGMIFVVGAALALLWLAVRRALRSPVAELTALVAWTDRVAADATPGELPETRTREIEKLETAFGALVDRLFRALERERATSAHVAHELRTPLTSIVVELDSLMTDDPTVRAMVARVRADAERLSDVVEAILLLSGGDRQASDVVVNVGDLVRGLVSPQTNVDAPDEALVRGDERLLSLAVRNLIDNAGKYGSGVERIAVERAGSSVCIRVSDRGPGLSNDECAKIFDRYWRGAADGEGRGLGLALVKEVAERHGGSAQAERGATIGLEVTIVLPLIAWSDPLRSG